jgi:hypothetical protein
LEFVAVDCDSERQADLILGKMFKAKFEQKRTDLGVLVSKIHIMSLEKRIYF